MERDEDCDVYCTSGQCCGGSTSPAISVTTGTEPENPWWLKKELDCWGTISSGSRIKENKRMYNNCTNMMLVRGYLINPRKSLRVADRIVLDTGEIWIDGVDAENVFYEFEIKKVIEEYNERMMLEAPKSSKFRPVSIGDLHKSVAIIKEVIVDNDCSDKK